MKKLHANEIEVEATGNWRDELQNREIERQLDSYDARKGTVATKSDADMLKERESDAEDVEEDDGDSLDYSDSECEGEERGPKEKKQKPGVIDANMSAKEWKKKIKEDNREKRVEKADKREAKRRHNSKKKK